MLFYYKLGLPCTPLLDSVTMTERTGQLSCTDTLTKYATTDCLPVKSVDTSHKVENLFGVADFNTLMKEVLLVITFL